MMKKAATISSLFVLAAVLFAVGLMAPAGQPVQAAPPAVATPALEIVWSAEAITASTRSNAFLLGDYSEMDFQVTTVQGSSVNTASLTYDRSNDGYNWATGPSLLSSSAISTTAVVSKSVIGRYGSVYLTLANSNPVTITVLGWKN